MKKNKIAVIISLWSILSIHGQNNKTQLGLMQGVWQNLVYGEEEAEKYKGFVITKGMKSLNFVFISNSNELDFPLGESLKGFQSISSDEKKDININTLKEDGKYYTIIFNKDNIKENGDVGYLDFLTPYYFECDGEYMAINGGKMIEYFKIKTLSKKALIKLYLRGKRDQRNYIKEFLDLDVREITTPKTYIYTAPNLKGKMYLLKGDIVTVLEEEKDFVKFEYETDKERIITGYLKKEDLE